MGKLLAKILAALLVLASIVYLLVTSMEPNVVSRAAASTRYDKWRAYWQQGHELARVRLGKELLPTTLPGPRDQWAGSKPHQVVVDLEAGPGDYRLTLLFHDCDAAAPPVLGLDLDGRRLAELALPPGHGLPAPYLSADPLLTQQMEVRLSGGPHRLTLTSLQGGWSAPAGLRLSRGETINLSKVGYLLVAQKKLYLFPLILVLALALFLWVAARSGPGPALASVVMVLVSCALAFAVGEYAFREYLIRAPQARALEVQRGDLAKDLKGMNLSFDKMIEPTPFMDITYQLRPNLDGFFGGHRLRTNSQHMRSPEVSLEKPPNTLRLMGLGDSVLFGWAVAAEDALLGRLAGLLADTLGRPVQELNLACPSYNTAVEVAVYARRGRQFKPDVVVLLFVANDFDPPSVMFEPVRRFNLTKSYIIEQLRRRFAAGWRDAPPEQEALFTSRDQGGHLIQPADRAAWRQRLEAFYQRMTGKEAVAAGIRDLAGMLKEDGALGVVVYYPTRIEPLDEKVVYALDASRQAGLITLDMTPVLKAYLEQTGQAGMKEAIWVNPGDAHPNAKGHELMARAVLKAILASGRYLTPRRESLPQ